MRTIIMALASSAFLLSGCLPGASVPGPVASPSTVPATNGPGVTASGVVLDEKRAIALTNAYTAASKLGAAAARAGVIDRAKFKALDAKGYKAVQAVRVAYLVSNARNYGDAIVEGWGVVRQMGELAPAR